MSRRDLSFLNKPITIAVRGICGGVFGLFVTFGWRRWGWGAAGTVNWVIAGVAVAMCALLAIRYGDEFWSQGRW